MSGKHAGCALVRNPRRRFKRRLRAGGFRRKLVTLFVLILIGVGVLPIVIAKTPLHKIFFSMLVPGDTLQVTFGNASLSWFSSPSLSNVDVREPSGESLFVAESISVERTPLHLATKSHDLGMIQIVRPVVHVKVRPDGSNLEDVIAKLTARFAAREQAHEVSRASSKPVSFAVQLVNGTILADDIATGRQWRLQNVNVQYDARAGVAAQGSLTGEMVVADRNASPMPAGRFTLSLKPADDGKQLLNFQAEGVALAIAEPWLRRFETGAELSGTLSGQAKAQWSATNATIPTDLTTSAEFDIARLDATSRTIGPDRARLSQVRLLVRQTPEAAGLKLNTELRTDVADCVLWGHLDSAALARSLSTVTTASDQPAQDSLELHGSIDIAKVAAMLPRTLSIRPDTRIDSGTIELTGSLKPSASGQVVTAAMSATQLSGTSAGKIIRWDQPLNAKLNLHRTNGVVALDSLHCDSKFLRVEATGNLQQLTANAEFDLNALSEQLSQFVNLGSVQLAGSGSAQITLQQPSTGKYAGKVSSSFRQLRVATGPWRIEGTSDLTADVSLAGTNYESSNTKLIINDLRAASPAWNINEPRVEFSGDARFDSATGEFAANSAKLVSSTVALATQGIHYGGAQQGAGRFTGSAAFRTDLARLASWRSAASQAAQYRPSGEFTGNVRFVQQAGRITGEISATGQKLALASLNLKNVLSTPGYETIWQEPQLTIRGNTNYDSAADVLNFEQFQIQSNTVQANASGQIQKLSTVAECNLNGTLNYDLSQVTPLLMPYVGAGIQLTGREQARFVLAGKLSDGGTNLAIQPVGLSSQSEIRNPKSEIHWSRRIRAQLELPWTGANVYGMPVGAGRIAASLGEGGLRVEPIALRIGEGQLTAAPAIRFDPEPAEVVLPGGPLLTNVRISPEVSEAMLKYVAPVLAGATQSEGLFSLQLDGARVPLADPKRADSAGQLTVHSVRVVPGPMASQWVGIAQQVEALARRRDGSNLNSFLGGARTGDGRQVTLLSLRDQQVNFRVADGRVHHQNVEFQVGEVTLRSQGSVGFDQTIALTLQIPIQDVWVDNQPLLAGLKGQTLEVPVSGTLTKPTMDQRAISHLTGQLFKKGAGQAVGNELNKALDKFLKPR
jgi:hypothetical protein